MKLILRDDDLSYFATPDHLAATFQSVWDSHPIHFATIPYVYTRQNQTPLHLHPEKDNYWIGENKELVSFLQGHMQQGHIKIWQHGFSHRDRSDGRYELEGNDEEELYHKLSDGKQHLEEIFQTEVDVLVPPHDRISRAGIKAAVRAGFTTICRGFSPLPRDFCWNRAYFQNIKKLWSYYLLRGTNVRYPSPLQFDDYQELYSYRIQQIGSKEYIDKKLLPRHQDGILVLTSHYRTVKKVDIEKIIYISKQATEMS